MSQHPTTTIPPRTPSRRPGRLLAGGLAAAALATVALLPAANASGGASVGFTGGISERDVAAWGETFFVATASNVTYTGGPVLLAGSSSGTDSTWVDDLLIVKVLRPDGTTQTYKHDYSSGCRTAIIPMAPVDLSNLFQVGRNKVTVTLKDKCGGSESAGPIWLLP